MNPSLPAGQFMSMDKVRELPMVDAIGRKRYQYAAATYQPDTKRAEIQRDDFGMYSKLTDTMEREGPEGTSVPQVHIAVNAHREPAHGGGVADFHADMAEALDKPQPGNSGHRLAIADMPGWDRIRCSPHVEYTGDEYTHFDRAQAPAERGRAGGMSVIEASVLDSLGSMDMTDTINETWQAIRHQEPDVPEVQVSIVPGPGSRHWRSDPRVLHVPERIVNSGAQEILGFLLHFAAHDLVPDRDATSGSEGSYHGEAYRKAAERLHLQVDTTVGHGWSKTTVTPELEKIYVPQLRQLDTARKTWGPATPADRKLRNRNGIVAACQCHPEFKISIRRADAEERLARHPILCSACGKPFVPVERAEEARTP